MADHDAFIDATLKDVAVPADVGRRLAPERLFTDAAIDRILTRVELPAGLADRVRATARAEPPGRVPGPVDLERIAVSAVRPAPPAARSVRWLATLGRDAARVAIALAVVCGLFRVGREWSRSLEAPVVATTEAAVEPALARSTAAPEPRPRTQAPAVAATRQQPVPRPAPPSTAVAAVPLSAQPREQESAEPLAVRGAALGLPGDAATTTAAILAVEMPQDARRAVPRVAGYDLGFEMAHGEQPFVDPAVVGLAIDRPPLTLRTDTFDLLRLGAVLRPPARFRVEHLLAALPTALPAGRGPRLEVRGVRARRPGDAGPRLLVEVLAAAPARASGERPPIHATVVLDRGPSANELTWSWACQGLAAVAAQLTPADRVSVVLAGPVPRRVARHAGAAALAELAVELATIPPTPAADLDAALALARADDGRVVIVTQADVVDAARGDARRAFGAWRSQLETDRPAAADAPRFVLVDAATATGPAATAPRRGLTPAEPAAVRRQLLAQVLGGETLVARHCRVEVAFAPGAVAAYRLVGHRQSAVESLAMAPADAVDLHAGEAVRAVYEVVPRGEVAALPGDAVVATLRWREPAADAERTLRTPLDRGAGDLGPELPSPRGCELLLAVGAGELMSGSAHLPQRGAASAALGDLLARWRARGDVTPFAARVAALLLEPARGSDR